MTEIEKKKEETKPRRKWDMINEEMITTLKQQGQDITMALSDPTQALIIVPQKLAIQTIGTTSDLEELLALTKKGTYQYSRNLCINHLNDSLRQYFLKKSTQVYLEKEYNVLIKVNGRYKEDINQEFYGKDINLFLNSGKINSIPKYKIPLHLSIQANNMMELETALNSI